MMLFGVYGVKPALPQSFIPCTTQLQLTMEKLISLKILLGLPTLLRHLLVRRILQLLHLIVMRRNFSDPFALDFHHL